MTSGYPVDLAIPQQRVAIEADGPSHLSRNTLRPLGHTAFKHRLLKAQGWHVISVPWHEWDELIGAELKREYLQARLQAVGVAV